MQAFDDNDIAAMKARRPSVADGVVEREAEEYQNLLCDSFLTPPPGMVFETAESEAGPDSALLPLPSPPADHARINELGHRLFDIDERGGS